MNTSLYILQFSYEIFIFLNSGIKISTHIIYLQLTIITINYEIYLITFIIVLLFYFIL